MTSSSPASGFAAINGAQIFYEVAGSGKPVVFSHAGIADNRMWDDQFGVFAQRYRVIRFDHRSMGQSSMPPGPFALREDIYGLMRFLNVDRAALIGCSIGGAAALDCALAHPEAVAALVLVDSGVSGQQFTAEEEQQGEAIFGPIEEAQKRGDLDTANELELRLWVDGPRRTPDQVNPAVREKVRQMNLNNLRREHEMDPSQSQRLQPTAIDRLGEVRCPTLVLAGTEDVPPVLATARLLATGIPGAREVIIPDAAHLPNMEQPAEFNRIVLDFLAAAGW